MLSSVLLVLTFAGLTTGQGPGVVSPETATTPKVEIIFPEATHDNASLETGEIHATEDPHFAPPRLWAKTEYLLWFNKAAHFPVLLTTGLDTDKLPGALGNSDTSVVFGGNVKYHDLSGGRFTFGYFLDPADMLGLEGGFLFLGRRPVDFAPYSPGNPVLARPFFDVLNNSQNSSLSAFPGLIKGSVNIQTTTFLDAAEANGSLNLFSGPRCRLDALAGFRYWHLNEDLSIDEYTQVNATAPVFAGNSIHVADYFATDNSFYGGQLGLRGQFQLNRLTAEFTTKVAMGCSQEILTIRGDTFINTTPATALEGGLLALTSNIGRYAHNDFVVIPEVGLNLGYRVTDRIQLFVGYSFMYWAKVLRPGDQVDTNVNTNLVPTSNTYGVSGGPSNPAVALHETGYWVQGLNFGLEIRY